MRRLLLLSVLVLSGCPGGDLSEPSCPTLYCLSDGSGIVWDPCRPHPTYDDPSACAGCHAPHSPGGMSPVPCP